MPKRDPPERKPLYECVFDILAGMNRLPTDCRTPWCLFTRTLLRICSTNPVKQELQERLKRPETISCITIAVNGAAYCAVEAHIQQLYSSGFPPDYIWCVLDGVEIETSKFLFSERAQTCFFLVSANKKRIVADLNIVVNQRGTKRPSTKIELSHIVPQLLKFSAVSKESSVRLSVDCVPKKARRRTDDDEECEDEEPEEALQAEGAREDELLDGEVNLDEEAGFVVDQIRQSMQRLHNLDDERDRVGADGKRASGGTRLERCLEYGFDLLSSKDKGRFCAWVSKQAEQAMQGARQTARSAGPLPVAAHAAVAGQGPAGQHATAAAHSTPGSAAGGAPEPAGAVQAWYASLVPPSQPGPALLGRKPRIPQDAQIIVEGLARIQHTDRQRLGAYETLSKPTLCVPLGAVSILERRGLTQNVFHQLMALFHDETLVAYLALVAIDTEMTRKDLRSLKDAMPGARRRIESWITLTRTPAGLLHAGLNVQFGSSVDALNSAITDWISNNARHYTQLPDVYEALCEMFIPPELETMTSAEFAFLRTFLLAIVANQFARVHIVPATTLVGRLPEKGFKPPRPGQPFVLVSFTLENEMTVQRGRPLPFLPEYAGMVPELCKRTGDGGMYVDASGLHRTIQDTIERIAKESREFAKQLAQWERESQAREQERKRLALEFKRERPDHEEPKQKKGRASEKSAPAKTDSRGAPPAPTNAPHTGSQRRAAQKSRQCFS